MFTTFVRFALENLARKWLMNPSTSPSAPPVRFNTEEIKALFVRLGSLATLVFLNFNLFVGATVVTVVAVAHSFDVQGQFTATSVFWSGIIMGATALVIGGISGWALLSTKVSMNDLIVTEPVIEAASLKERILTPFLSGLAAGLRSPKARAETMRAEYPAA